MNQNYWARIRAHYKRATPAILACEKNEWALDAYAWEALGAIHFTPIEEWLWHDIRAVDVVLYPQYPVLKFFVDFANPKAKVAVFSCGIEASAPETKGVVVIRNADELKAYNKGEEAMMEEAIKSIAQR